MTQPAKVAEWRNNCLAENVGRNARRPALRRCLLLGAMGVCLGNSTADTSVRELPLRLIETTRRQGSELEQLQSWRRYVLHNPRWEKDATMDVLIRLNGSGAEEDPRILGTRAQGLQAQILRRIIEGEVDASRGKQEFLPITPENYTMQPAGIETVQGRPCKSYAITPKKPTRYTIEGHACVDLEEAAVVRFAGRTSRSVSFWIGKPWVEQEFRKVGAYWLCSRNHSTANVRILGETSLTIEYRDYVVRPKSGPTLSACAKTPCGAHCFDH